MNGEEKYKVRAKPRNRKDLVPETSIILTADKKRQKIYFGALYKKFADFIRNSPSVNFKITIQPLRKGSRSAAENNIHHIERNK